MKLSTKLASSKARSTRERWPCAAVSCGIPFSISRNACSYLQNESIAQKIAVFTGRLGLFRSSTAACTRETASKIKMDELSKSASRMRMEPSVALYKALLLINSKLSTRNVVKPLLADSCPTVPNPLPVINLRAEPSPSSWPRLPLLRRTPFNAADRLMRALPKWSVSVS